MARRRKARHGAARQGSAWHGMARGLAWKGVAWPGRERRGLARLGLAGDIAEGDAMQVAFEFQGRTGLVMHNVRLADKYDPYTQQIGALTDKKKNRTEADDAEITRLEWYGGLYHAPDIGVYIPSANVVRCLQNAGVITRDGTTVVRGISMLTDRLPLSYPGPRELAELFAKPEYGLRIAVGVQRSKVMRMRPIFRTWSLSFEVEMAEDVMDLDALIAIAERAGRSEGLGDARKLGYGRFNVEVVGDQTHAQVLHQQRRNGGARDAATVG